MLSRRLALSVLPVLAAGASPARAETGFAAFLAGVRVDALQAGVSPATVDRAFAKLQPNPRVLELDSRPAEATQSWDRYRASRVSDQRVSQGRQAAQDNRAVLTEINRRYGVDPAIIVAIWGVETNYGAFTGGFSVIEALATLAADGRRNGYFRTELINALRILDHGDITLPRMTGSYAGAMGQPQFMPSSYLEHAVSYDGGPRRDIWTNRADALASIANYLVRYGWTAGVPWGQPIRVPAGFDAAQAGRDNKQPLGTWAARGVTRADGSPFGRADVMGAVILPDGPGGAAYMAYANFDIIRLYNRSDLYVLSVGVLADRIAGQDAVP